MKGFFNGGYDLSNSIISSTKNYTALLIIRAQFTISSHISFPS